jgi:hypothetical protein
MVTPCNPLGPQLHTFCRMLPLLLRLRLHFCAELIILGLGWFRLIYRLHLSSEFPPARNIFNFSPKNNISYIICMHIHNLSTIFYIPWQKYFIYFYAFISLNYASSNLHENLRQTSTDYYRRQQYNHSSHKDIGRSSCNAPVNLFQILTKPELSQQIVVTPSNVTKIPYYSFRALFLQSITLTNKCIL